MKLYDVYTSAFELLGQVTASSAERALELAKVKWPFRIGLIVGEAEDTAVGKRNQRLVAGGLIGPYNRRVKRPH